MSGATCLGVDVSSYQGAIDWPAVATTRQFAIAKTSEGDGYLDPWFGVNWPGIRAAGLIRGAYHFARPDLGNGPEAEADWFLGRMSLAGGDLLALDLEAGSGNLLAWAQRWLEHVYAVTGVRPFWYSYPNFIDTRGLAPLFGSDFGFWAVNPEAFYPAPAMLQYSDYVPGIQGLIDADEFFGSPAQLLAYGLNGGPPIVPAWNGSYPMPDPPPASTEVDVVFSGTIGPDNGAGQAPHWWTSPNGMDAGAAPIGAAVTAYHCAYDGVNWWCQIGPPSGAWWLTWGSLRNAPSPAGAWNQAHQPPPAPQPPPVVPDDDSALATKADLAALAQRVSKLEAAPRTGTAHLPATDVQVTLGP